VGDARARGLALLGEPLSADTAADWGLIWRAVDDGQLRAEAETLTARLAAEPTQGFALTKQAFAHAATNSLDAQLDLERDLQRKAGRTPDYAEGVSAFMTKRPPLFTGRSK
jgi:2-(1,2-epoxy-1,2-dihydrophenyl)acetyl-CoA isomerase